MKKNGWRDSQEIMKRKKYMRIQIILSNHKFQRKQRNWQPIKIEMPLKN